MSAIPDIPFSASWVDINTVSGVSVGSPFLIQNKRSTWAIIQESDTAPSNDSTDGSLLSPMGDPSGKCYIQQGSGKIWIKSFSGVSGAVNINDGLSIQIDNYTDSPEGLYSGTRAMTTQSYTEANIKNGFQFEGSTVVTGVGNNQAVNTIFTTGAKPVILKARVISYSGEGVTAEIFRDVIFTGGTSQTYQNPNNYKPQVGLTVILSGATVTNTGTTAFAPITYIGNSSNQARGATAIAVGGERILAPNTSYLLRLTGIGSAQTISSFLSWYEGEPDLPLQ